MKTLRFPIDRAAADRTRLLGALLNAIHTISELEDELERAGALKGMHVLWDVKRRLAAEYPEFFAEVRLDGGAA